MRYLILFILCTCYSLSAIAQVPDTDIFIVAISKLDNKLKFGTPLNITSKPGYDNQPLFTRDSKKILYVSMTDSSQTDIYEYDIKKEETQIYGKTPESEYSPDLIPLSDAISVVRVDMDKSQRLYEFESSPLDASIVVEGLDSIGYYKWINDSVIALVVLNNGLELYIYELNTREYVIVDKNVGRCLLIDPATGNLLYTKPSKTSITQIMMIDNETLDSEIYCNGNGTAEDYVIAANGELWTGMDGKLFSKNVSTKSEWIEIADFSKSVGAFYRISISPDGKYLALVAYSGERP